MRRCEDEKMWRWEDVKMRRCFTDPHYWKNPALRRSREKQHPQAGRNWFVKHIEAQWRPITVPKDLQVVVLFDVPEVEGNQSDRNPQLWPISKGHRWLKPLDKSWIPEGKSTVSWLVVSTPLKILVSWDHYCQYMIYGKIKNVPNHQPVSVLG